MAKRGGFPGGMPGNMNNLMKQAQKMQKQMEENQKALEEKEFTATAGGGAVEVTISGKKEVTKVKISEDAVDPDDVEMLEDLIMAATNAGAPFSLSVEIAFSYRFLLWWIRHWDRFTINSVLR